MRQNRGLLVNNGRKRATKRDHSWVRPPNITDPN